MKHISDRVLLIALIASMCIWGISWSSAKVLSAYGNALQIAFIRFLFTFFALLIILKSLKVPLTITKNGYPWVIGAGIFMSLYGFLFFKGLQNGLSGAGGVLVTTINPLFAYALGSIINRNIPSRNEKIGLLLGIIAGAVLLKIWLRLDGLLASGNLFFLCAAITWAAMSKISSRANLYGNSLAFSLWMHLVGTSIVFCFVDIQEIATILQTGDSLFWGNILYFSTINSAFATTCYLFSAARLGAEKASGFIFLVPCGAAFSSWLFLGEAVTLTTLIGGAIGVLAVMVMNGKIKIGYK